MRFRFGKEDTSMIIFNLIVLGYLFYYNQKLILEDATGIYWIFVLVLGAIMVVSNFVSMLYSGQVLHLIFVAGISFLCYKAYGLNESDVAKIDAIFKEISDGGTPFDEFLDEEITLKGPIYASHNSWLYKRVNSAEFTIYRLDKMNLLRRDYNDGKGWYGVYQGDVVLKILQMRNLSEAEKEREAARVLAEMNITDFPQY